MSRKKTAIPFFTDNDVPDGVGEFLKDSGHTVVRLRECMLDTSADPVVAETCRRAGLVLVTHNIKHFRAIARDYQITKRETDRLCRVELACEQAIAEDRMRDALTLIEFEYARLGSDPKHLRVYVGDGIIRTHR